MTTVYVTHDQVEAMTMGHRVAVLKDGRLQQSDTPAKLYDEPVNTFVASFIGSPAITMTRSAVREGEVTIHGLPVSLDRSTLSAARGDVVVGFRPEAWQVVGAGEPGIDVAVDLVESLGSEAFVHGEPARSHDDATVAIGADRVTFKVIGKTDLDVGDTVRIAPIAEQAHVFDAESGMRLR